MPHPSLGLPPHDVAVGMPAAAARLRVNRTRLAQLALQTTLRAAPYFESTYSELALRQFLRDYDRHIEQLARSMETGDPYFVAMYAEWLVPIYRRRDVPMKDFGALVRGLQEAASTVLTPKETEFAAPLFARWYKRLEFHRRLAGDHRGNPVVRFFWKGAGILDEEIV